MATRSTPFDDEVARSFEEEWPELARRLERFLAAKGVERWLRADVIQETAARLYPRWETLDHSVPLWNLAATIAVRVVHNHRRKESRVELVPDPIPMPKDDVHVRGLQRAQLDKTRSALRHLTIDQRRVLLAELGEAIPPTGTRNRINVLRLRARSRLREALGPWAPSAITLKLRNLRARVGQKRALLEMSMPVANSLASVAMVATVGLAGVASSSSDVTKAMQPARAPLLSSTPARDYRLDSIGNPHRRLPVSSVTKDELKMKKSEGASESPSDTKDWVEYHKGWADRRQREVAERGEEVRQLGEDGAQLGDDARQEGERQVSHRQEEIGDRQEEVEDRQREVEELLPPSP